MAEKLTGRHKALYDQEAERRERERRPAAEDERRVDREIARRAQEERYREKTRKDMERFQRAGKKEAEDRKYEQAADVLAHNRKLRQKEEEEQKTKERAENLVIEAKELAGERERDLEQKKLFEAQERRQRATAGLRKKRPKVESRGGFFEGGFDYSRGIAKVKATRKKVATKRKVAKPRQRASKTRPASKSTLTGGRTEGPSGIFKDVWAGSEAAYLAEKIREVRKKPVTKTASVEAKTTTGKAKTARDPKTGRFISTGRRTSKRVVTSQKLMMDYKPFKEWVDSRKVSKETKARYWRDWQQFRGKARERFWVTFHVEGVDDRGEQRNFNWAWYSSSRKPSKGEIDSALEELKLQYDYLKVTKFFVLRSRELIGGGVRYHV